MSDWFNFSYTDIIIAIFGVTLLVIGFLLSYYALGIEWIVGPRILTPIGVVIALMGLLVLTSKEG